MRCAKSATPDPLEERLPTLCYYVLRLTLGNPKIMLFYLALLPTIVDLTHVGVLAWTELAGTMLAVLILADCFWSLLASRARALLTSARAKRIANRTSAAAMAGAGAGAAVAIATR